MKCGMCPVIVVAGAMAAVAGFGFAQPAGEKAKTDAAAKQPAEAVKKTDALESFRKLAGKWHGTGHEDSPMKEIDITYKVTAGGSAVVETLFPGAEHEMVTVYFLNGGEVWLTHYCMMGNQPTMKGDWTLDGKTCAFNLVSATNCDIKKDTCMGKAAFEFVDADHIKTKWYTTEKGESHEHVEFSLTRVK